MPRVNITGGWYSSRNAGDQAILICIYDLLKERVPDLTLEVICANDDFVRNEYGIEAISQTKHLFKVLAAVARSDALFIGGGTPFYDDFKHMCFFWVLSAIAKLTKGKLAVYGASAQKLHRASAKWFTRRILNMANLITVREPLTKSQFESLGVHEKVHCTADPAITLRPCEKERIDALLEKEGLAGRSPLFAICPHFFSNTDPYRVHHYEKLEDDLIQRQKSVLAQAADYLSERGAVLFLPMNTDPPDSDLDVQREIAALVRNKGRIRFVETQYRPREVAGILSRCKLALGVRLHSLVLSAAVDTPVIAVSYAPKVAGFMERMEEAHHSCPLQKLEFPALLAMIDAFLEDYDRQHAIFRGHAEQLRNEARRNADMAAALLRSSRGPR